jgi:hypothetical protein
MKTKFILIAGLLSLVFLQSNSYASTALVKLVDSNNFDPVNFNREIQIFDDGTVTEIVGPQLVSTVGFQTTGLATLSATALSRLHYFMNQIQVTGTLVNVDANPGAQQCQNEGTTAIYLETAGKEVPIYEFRYCQNYLFTDSDHTRDYGADSVSSIIQTFLDLAK